LLQTESHRAPALNPPKKAGVKMNVQIQSATSAIFSKNSMITHLLANQTKNKLKLLIPYPHMHFYKTNFMKIQHIIF